MAESIGLALDKGLSKVREIKVKSDYFADDEYVMSILEELLPAYQHEIHDFLIGIGTDESECVIRKRVKEVIMDILPIIDAKGRRLNRYIDFNKGLGLGRVPDKLRPYAERYVIVRDGYYALAAFRSLRHFFLFMEEDRDCVDKKIWGDAPPNLYNGYWTYANRKILERDVPFIMKQWPTGYGKTASDAFEIAFLMGYDIGNDVIKVFGNPTNVGPGFDFITKIMLTKHYAMVFPYYAQFKCEKNDMFEICKATKGEFKITGSKQSRNVLVVSKETQISGARAKYLYLDDITQQEDAPNLRMHDSDVSKFLNVWFKRNHDLNNFFISVSGTTYSEYDILSTLKKMFGGEEAEKGKFKYTTEVRNGMVKEGGISAFITIPKLDYDTDESTYPQKYPTAKARRERASNEEMFMAMEQQLPPPPEGTPFSYKVLKTYDTIKRNPDDLPITWAMLDPARTGKNYVCMPIFEVSNHHYLKDIIYELIPMKKVYSIVVEKVIRHRITRLHIENNTDTSLATLLRGLFVENGINWCEITEAYTYKQKIDKIYSAEAAIKENLVFPFKGMYAESSPMGKAMKEFTGFSYTRKNAYDDMTDSIAMYTEKFILGERKPSQVIIIDRRADIYNVR